MRVNLLTPGFTTSNGSALLFPLVVFKNAIRKAGMEIRFVKRSDKKISDCDILAIDSKEFMTLPVQTLDLIDSYRKSNNKIIWFDTTDSTGTLQSDILPIVDSYAKSQLLKNKNRYTERIYGGRVHSQYYKDTAGVIDQNNESTAINKPVEKDSLSKLKISWNSGLADYSTYGPLMMRIYKSIHWSKLLRYRPEPNLSNAKRDNDLSARFGISYSRASVRYQREQIRNLLRNRMDTNKVNRKTYFKELKQSKVVLSPFGWGEITLKDFEVFATGGMLLKPSMDHMETWPNFYEDGITYKSHNWNMDNLEKEIERSLADEQLRYSIATEGRQRYLKHTSDPDASEIFTKHLTSVLST